MAADLFIHIIPNEEVEKHVEQYLQTEYWSSDLGNCYDLYKLKSDGKWYRNDELPEYVYSDDVEFWDVVEDKKTVQLNYNDKMVFENPQEWIGEVSWLKAGLFGDSETFIPSTVQKISDIINGIVELTEDVVAEIIDAFSLENNTGYDLNNADKVESFLKQYIGKKAFCVSH